MESSIMPKQFGLSDWKQVLKEAQKGPFEQR